MKEDDELFDVKKTSGNEDIFVAASNGKLVRFNEENIRSMGRTASGVRSIRLNPEEFVVGVTTSNEGDHILAITGRGYGKMSHIDEYRQMVNRGGKGVKTVKVGEKNGSLVSIKAVKGDEDLLVVTDLGVIIRISLDQVKVASRNTMGVRIIKLDENTTVSSLAVVEKEVEEVVEENENKE